MASLTQGSPGVATGTVTSSTPQWMQDAIYNTITWSQNLANKPYTPYGGERLAQFTPTERQGMQQAVGAAGAYQPLLTQAGETLGRATTGGGLAAAAPYAAAAAKTFPQAVEQYMSPYTKNVLGQIADVGVRQLQEKLLPAVGEEFIKAGQFGPGRGSSRMGEFGARALRDTQEAILAEQSKALESGYQTAGKLFGEDVGRQAQLASTLGQLSGQDIANLRQTATQQAALGEAAQTLGLRGAAAVTGAGEAERNLAQKALDLAYQQYEEERKYPYEQLGFQAGIIGGISPTMLPRTETTTETSTPAGASNLSNILATLLGGAGIYKTLTGP